MSARGVKFLFSPGEAVLCFEPDPTKARVLYDAKVLDTNVGKGRVAEYHIHFQGWNSSWDRIVPEDFVLRNTEEHRNVMKRIAKIARKVKRNKMRKKKIDKILDRVLRRSRRGGDDGSGGDDESDMSEDKDCESDDSEEEDSDTGSTGDDDSDGRLGARGPGSDKSDGPASCSEHQMTSEPEEEEDEINLDRIPELRLEIPEILKKHLEDDCYFVLRKNKLVRLPADPNIITILEGYVKSFAINILCASTEKVRVRGEQLPTPPERNIELCKELVDGLRLMFDFILPTHLLYNVEEVPHANLQTTFKPPFGAKSDSSETDEPPPAVPMSPRGRTTRQSVSSPPAEPPLKIPRLSPKNIKKEPLDDEDEAPTRRITRKSLAEAERAGRSLDQPPVMEKSPVLESKEMSVRERRRSKAESKKTGRELRRSSTRLNSSGSQASTSKSSSEGRTLSQRITPPPPLLLPSVMSSKTSSAHVTPTLKSVNTGTSASRATSNFGPPENGAQLNGILSWKLIPPEVYAETPPPPSVMYGVHHLLRLFVKLPEFVNCMPMPHHKRVVLQKHLDMILEYLVENTELFPESAYVDVPASSPTKPEARRR
ncbi:male-specific lethal 3 homolog [Lineus longissimus]|uniref:male-specific lethal 3 homolog n=1 Tax=Lineus longissimus TaxID=88925 RepID=UPI002B4E2E9D